MRIFTLVIALVFVFQIQAQTSDEVQLRNIYDKALTDGKAYEWLDHLSNEIGGRLSGSPQAQQAIEYTKAQLEALDLDKVWLQPVMVPKWTRGTPESAYFEVNGEQIKVPVCALGGSVATPKAGLKAKIIEVRGIEDLEALGKEEIRGKIVFYNRPMDPKLISTFQAYSGCVDQRYSGAAEAGKFGAVGVIVRSMNLRLDDLPHTGSMSYGETKVADRVPAAAISTQAAENLSKTLAAHPETEFFLKQNCEQFEDVGSFNVIGEITGSKFPNEVMVVGGHLDSWDLGDGSHDDGAGVVQSMDVLRLIKASGYTPQRSIRVVLFMNEENGLRGGKKYAEVAMNKKEKHVFALESDAGGFTPRGFSFDCSEPAFVKVQAWKPLFEPYLIHLFVKGYAGADIGSLKEQGLAMAGLRPDSQRYFDHHHAANDTFEHVNKRELELGAATMASLMYLVDKYGLESIEKVKG